MRLLNVFLSAVISLSLVLQPLAFAVEQAPSPRPFLALVSIGLAALMVLAMIASLLAPVLLRPCD